MTKKTHKEMVIAQPPHQEEELWREFGHAMIEMERRMERALRSVAGTEGLPGPLVHGVSLSRDIEGDLRFQSFGNLYESLGKVLEGWREPVVTLGIDQEAQCLLMRVELPGLHRNDLKVASNASMVHVEGQSGDAKYRVTCTPGCRLADEGAQAHYENGLLTLRIPLATGAAGRNVPVS